MKNLLDLKTFFKFLSRNKAYTAIDLFGLSVSLTFVILIAIYSAQEFSTDKFQEKGERVYFVGSEGVPCVGAAIPYMMKERYPEIEKVCPLVVNQFSGMKAESEGKKLNANLMFADSTFFDIFSFPLLQGDAHNALVAQNNVVVSQSFARKLFGTEDVVGRGITIEDSLQMVVSGVVADLKHSTIPEADIIMPWRTVAKFNPSLAPDELNNAGSTTCAVLVHEGADFTSRAEDIAAWYKTFFWPYENGYWKEVRMESLANAYFSEWTSWPLLHGDKTFVVVLVSVGVVILIFAILNYINLSVAQAGFRAKEMATRRLLGSTRAELFWRLIYESVLMCLFSLVVAIFLALAIAPEAGNLLQVKLDTSVLLSPLWIGAILAFVLLVGGVAGWLPAMMISAVKPIDAVHGTFRRQTKMVFSKVFITFQNFITIIMLSCSLVMILQINHLLHAPLGYNTKGVYCMVPSNIDQQAFRDKLLSISGVNRVGISNGVPFLGSNNNTIPYVAPDGTKTNISFQQYPMDSTTFEILGLKLLRDNHLANPKWYLNEEAMRQMSLSPDATDFRLLDETIAISGIISDFHEGNITNRVAPVMLRFKRNDEPGWYMIAELQGDMYSTVKQIEEAYSEMTGGLEIMGGFLDEALQESFDFQIRLAKIVGAFTVVAILISLLGLLAMSTYFIQQRSLEVAIRKVFGSDNEQIMVRLVRTFLTYVGIAFILAVPVAYYFMRDWLSDYEYRISLSPWIFLAAGLFCLLISFLTVAGQSWKAANKNPIESMRGRVS